MGVIGGLSEYMQYQASESLTHSGAGSSAIQAGIGAGIGMQLGAQPWANRPTTLEEPAQQRTAIAPPPPPVEHVWHIAANGETTGPFSKAALGRMVETGDLSRDTYVWTPGQDGWLKADEVMELAQLFTILPPPAPSGA
jgi:hypothetical protein